MDTAAAPGSVTIVEVGETLESAMVRELGTPGDPLRPVDMAEELRAAGLPAGYRQVGSIVEAGSVPGLLVAVEAEPDEVAALPDEIRRRLVAVTDVPPGEAAAWVARHGLLGVVTPFTWVRWVAGMMGASGVFGRADVAAAAGLTQRAETGALMARGRWLELPDLLARYLTAAGPIVLP
jgi:hypothetical protein